MLHSIRSTMIHLMVSQVEMIGAGMGIYSGSHYERRYPTRSVSNNTVPRIL